MTQIDRLIEALADVAYAPSRDDWASGIRRLRNSLAFLTSHYRPSDRQLIRDHEEAALLLDFSAEIGEDLGRRSERRARRKLLERAVINEEPDLPARFPFALMPFIDASGHGKFKIVGPKDPSGHFLINYAFWKVANEFPVARWRTFLLRTCPVCGESYRDGRVVMRGGLLSRCRKCLDDDRRKQS